MVSLDVGDHSLNKGFTHSKYLAWVISPYLLKKNLCNMHYTKSKSNILAKTWRTFKDRLVVDSSLDIQEVPELRLLTGTFQWWVMFILPPKKNITQTPLHIKLHSAPSTELHILFCRAFTRTQILNRVDWEWTGLIH